MHHSRRSRSSVARQHGATQLPEQYLKRQERTIKRIGDYSGSIKPPTFDMNNPQPYPYGRFRAEAWHAQGWTPATVDEWRSVVREPPAATYIPLIRHTLRAHFAEGVNYDHRMASAARCFLLKEAIDIFYKCKLVIAPWNLDWRGRPFWGMMDSEAKAKERSADAVGHAAQKSVTKPSSAGRR